MTTTTDLIKILSECEKGASGRSRELSIYVNVRGERVLLAGLDIKRVSTGDGCAGAEMTLEVDAERTYPEPPAQLTVFPEPETVTFTESPITVTASPEGVTYHIGGLPS